MTLSDLLILEEVRDIVDDWLIKFNQLHEENSTFEEFESMDREQTKFYGWFYGKGQVFNVFDSYNSLESIYNDLYDALESYLKTKIEPENKSFFSLNNTKRKLNRKAKKVRHHTKKLILSMDMFEDRVRRLVLSNEEKEDADIGLDKSITEEVKLSDKEEEKVIETTETLETKAEFQADISEDEEDKKEEKEVAQMNLKDDIEEIRRKMEEDFKEKLKKFE